MANPKVATRSCEDCQRWRYNEETGRIIRDFYGNPVARYKGEKLPCNFVEADGSTACPKGTPDADVALWPHNLAAYEHYKRCKAVGRFPADSIIEANAAIIADVESQWERASRERLEILLARQSH